MIDAPWANEFLAAMATAVQATPDDVPPPVIAAIVTYFGLSGFVSETAATDDEIAEMVREQLKTLRAAFAEAQKAT